MAASEHASRGTCGYGRDSIQSHLPVLQCVSTCSPSVFFSWTALKMAAAPNAPIAMLAFTSSASMASADEMYSCQKPEFEPEPELEVGLRMSGAYDVDVELCTEAYLSYRVSRGVVRVRGCAGDCFQFPRGVCQIHRCGATGEGGRSTYD